MSMTGSIYEKRGTQYDIYDLEGWIINLYSQYKDNMSKMV